NERLEFLGDSILGFTAAEYLYHRAPPLPEGKMTRLRSELVCERSLHKTARALDLGEYLLMGRGEETTGGRERPSVLADAMEAVFAAVFLDGGRGAAAELITRLILTRTDEIERESSDFKTALQELVQQKPGLQIVYRLAGEVGPDHQKLFRIEAVIGDTVRGEGEGASKKVAEQAAARAALQALQALQELDGPQ
ncbi:MAG: ribonuclease III, partial [Oscillospiraceae bacterium]|nr:ribonuclease III [Oscillospiraceae bacterium]